MVYVYPKVQPPLLEQIMAKNTLKVKTGIFRSLGELKKNILTQYENLGRTKKNKGILDGESPE